MKLLINKVEVPPCTCTKTSTHWSVKDILVILGRNIAEADLIEIEIEDEQ